MLLCICSNLSEGDFNKYIKEPNKNLIDNEIINKINQLGKNCGSCIDRTNDIIKSYKVEKKED